jgi:predicted aspartyl protease
LSYKAFTFHVPANRRSSIVIDIEVAMLSQLFPKKPKIFYPVKALIDTGATCSGIKQSFVKTINPTVYGYANIKTLQGEFLSSIYKVDIRFPTGLTARNIRISEFFTAQEFDIIIGMDILRLGDMAITNAKNNTVFSFRVPPAKKHIDFTKFAGFFTWLFSKQ